MIQSSRICSFVKNVYKLFLESKLYLALLAVVNFFADSYSDSVFRKKLIGKGDIEDNAPASLFYKILGKISGFITSSFEKFFGSLSKAFPDSLIKHVYDHYFTRPFDELYIYFVSFVSVVIFVIPHDFWSNLFGIFFAVVLFLLYAVALAGKRNEYVPSKNINKIWFSVILFGFSLILSCFVSYDRGDSIRVLLFFITSFMLCHVIYASVKDEKGLSVILGFMYASLIITSLFALAQRAIGVEADASLTDLTLNASMPGRVFSTLANPNNYAEFLVLFMPFAFVYALNTEKGRKRIALIAGMILPMVAILLTYSRSGWIALAISVVIFVYLYDKRLVPVFIVLGIMAIPFIPQNILNRILTIGNLEDTSSSYRVDIWTGCLDMLKEYWFTGVGLGTGGFAEIYPEYARGESGVAPHSHMHFMEMLIELGVVGFISYISMTFCLIRRSFKAAARNVPVKVRNVAIASAAAMMGIVLIGCFEYCWFYPRVMFAFFVCAGVGMAAYKCSKAEK